MALTEELQQAIVDYVKKEPRTVQDIARVIHKSWLTADSYVHQIHQKTGLVSLKTFRPGTQGALKLVYYNYAESLRGNDLRAELFEKIRTGRFRKDFDFLELFQFVPEASKKGIVEQSSARGKLYTTRIIPAYQQAQSVIYCFSGNLSFVNVQRNQLRFVDVLEDLLRRKVRVKILCRVTLASLNNIRELEPLLKKYPEFIEVRHCCQPLRGFIIDDQLAMFRDEESLQMYREGELEKDTMLYYEIYDAEWIAWLQKVFWNLFRFSLDYTNRLREIQKLT